MSLQNSNTSVIGTLVIVKPGRTLTTRDREKHLAYQRAYHARRRAQERARKAAFEPAAAQAGEVP